MHNVNYLDLKDLTLFYFKLKYNKSYATIELEKQAKTILLQMKAKADAHNLLYDQGLFSYTMGLWENSDISLKDITRLRRPNTVFTGSELFRTFREPATEEQLKSIIDKKGRIPAVIDTADNAFLSYKSGVYECQNTELNLQLNVLIIGYGTENNIDYWLCKNSWGTSFGESGKFKIVRKNSPCGLKVFLL